MAQESSNLLASRHNKDTQWNLIVGRGALVAAHAVLALFSGFWIILRDSDSNVPAFEVEHQLCPVLSVIWFHALLVHSFVSLHSCKMTGWCESKGWSSWGFCFGKADLPSNRLGGRKRAQKSEQVDVAQVLETWRCRTSLLNLHLNKTYSPNYRPGMWLHCGVCTNLSSL